jgi:spore coat polysaccharide biosynthesis predicted glycosyltransferase SpsG
MRSLTLAAELISRGHEVVLLSGPIEIDWLRATIERSGVSVRECEYDTLPVDVLAELRPDWLVVDSYRIPAGLISDVGRHVRVLAIVDGDDRGIAASLYLDQNLGAEHSDRVPELEARFLAGATYALVREAVLDALRPEPWRIEGVRPRILLFIGGTDATGAVVDVAEAVAGLGRALDLTVVAASAHHSAIRSVVSAPTVLEVVAPTPDLPQLFASADVVISAAGTSAWDICTLGLPAVLLGVVDNQLVSLREATERGLALGVDITGHDVDGLALVASALERLLDDEELRQGLSRRARAQFDGAGAARVADRLEREPVGALLEW